jgi:hypothetical protein
MSGADDRTATNGAGYRTATNGAGYRTGMRLQECWR